MKNFKYAHTDTHIDIFEMWQIKIYDLRDERKGP